MEVKEAQKDLVLNKLTGKNELNTNFVREVNRKFDEIVSKSENYIDMSIQLDRLRHKLYGSGSLWMGD